MFRNNSFFFVSLFIAYFAFTKNVKSMIIDTNLTSSELIFHDSIALLNNQNLMFSDSRKIYNSGLDLFNNKNFIEAISAFSNAILLDSSFSMSYFYRAKCYEFSNSNLSILDYTMAFSLDSTNFSALYSLAELQFITDIEEASNTYHLIIKLNSQESLAYYEIGLLSYIQDSFDVAIEYFTHSIELKSDPRTFNDRASCYLMLDRIDLAIKDYIKALSLDPDLPFIYNNLASAYRKNEDFDKALDYYTLAISRDTNYALAYNNRGSLFLYLNKMESALIDINKAISIKHDYAPAFNNKGVIYHNQKSYAEAILYFDKAISLNDIYAKAFLNRGITRQMIRDEIGACSDWLKAKELGISTANKYLENDCN